MERREFWAVTLDMLVAIPACAAGWNIRNARDIHERVTIPAIKSKLVDVDFMRKRNRLRWLVAHVESFRRRVVGKSESDSRSYGSGADSDLERQQIGPARKNICHVLGDAVLEVSSL